MAKPKHLNQPNQQGHSQMSKEEFNAGALHADTQRYIEVIEEDMGDKPIEEYTPSKDIWKKCLPEEFTPEQVELLNENQPRLAAALAYVVGSKGLEYLKQIEGVKSLTKTIKYGNLITVEATIDKSRKFPVPNKPNETVTKYGHIKGKILYKNLANKGDILKVKDIISAKGASLFQK